MHVAAVDGAVVPHADKDDHSGKTRVQWVIRFKDGLEKTPEELGCSLLSSESPASTAPSTAPTLQWPEFTPLLHGHRDRGPVHETPAPAYLSESPAPMAESPGPSPETPPPLPEHPPPAHDPATSPALLEVLSLLPLSPGHAVLAYEAPPLVPALHAPPEHDAPDHAHEWHEAPAPAHEDWNHHSHAPAHLAEGSAAEHSHHADHHHDSAAGHAHHDDHHHHGNSVDHSHAADHHHGSSVEHSSAADHHHGSAVEHSNAADHHHGSDVEHSHLADHHQGSAVEDSHHAGHHHETTAAEVAPIGIGKLDLSNLPPAEPDEMGPTSTLSMIFITDHHQEQLVTFTQPRLGISLNNTNPVTVGRVVAGGHAEQLGVKVGWQIKQIDGREVTSIAVPTQAITAFVKSNSPRNTPRGEESTLKIDFRADKALHSFVFSNAPLGLELDSERPFVVNGVEPSSYAFTGGVRPGWEIVTVENTDVKSMDWPMVCRVISEKARHLPMGNRGEQPCG